nr:MAG TPA: peptidase [Caudoviricetes sp.]DAO81942.1 MAG TPA: peptidase [Bacteriophage sp.]
MSKPAYVLFHVKHFSPFFNVSRETYIICCANI